MLMIANPDLYKKIKLKASEILKSKTEMMKYDFIINEYDIETESERKEIV